MKSEEEEGPAGNHAACLPEAEEWAIRGARAGCRKPITFQ
jgi:hypothetical protein